ncbi:hypothetical protein, partial [Frankia sp. Cr1]|uniref:hypothetical protein n=1 Tax=Frankia sp. Cr1 TaxID=3073931 RepID=UPI002AD4C1CB
MPRARSSLRAEQDELRARMRDLGLGYDEIAAEFSRRFRLRPRAAYRHAFGWTLKQAAEQINTYTARSGMDPAGRAGMTPSHLCEYEQWPAGSGRKLTPLVLALLAHVYNTEIHRLLDFDDHEHLTPADRLLLDRSRHGIPVPIVAQRPPSSSAPVQSDRRSPASGFGASPRPGVLVPAQGLPAVVVPDQAPSMTRSLTLEAAEASDGVGLAAHTVDDVADLWDELMRRRDLLSGVGAGAVASFAAGLPTGPIPTTPETIGIFSELTASYRRLDGLLGPAVVFTPATDHQRRLALLLRRTHGHSPWQQVAPVAVDVNILVAWLYFDLEEYDQAAALYRHTFDVARDLDDVTLQAFLLGRMSRTLSECGHHTQAVVFADAARRTAGTTALPAVRSWLAVTGAYVHACLGNDRACRTALDDAVDLH